MAHSDDDHIPSLIDLPSESAMGPALAALTTFQQKFVVAMLILGDDNFVRAARMAGSKANPNSITVVACRLGNDPRIQLAMHEEAMKRLHSGKILAVSTLLTIARSAKKDSDKLKACDMILNRTGMSEKTEHKITVENTSQTDAALIARIEHLADKLGMDKQKLLGHHSQQPLPSLGPVVEAEFVEVPAYTDTMDDL